MQQVLIGLVARPIANPQNYFGWLGTVWGVSQVKLPLGGGHRAVGANCRDSVANIAVYPAVAEIITELIRFEPKICICHEKKEFKGKSASAVRDSLSTFPQICLCNGPAPYRSLRALRARSAPGSVRESVSKNRGVPESVWRSALGALLKVT